MCQPAADPFWAVANVGRTAPQRTSAVGCKGRLLREALDRHRRGWSREVPGGSVRTAAKARGCPRVAARWINAGILRQDATTHHLSCVAAAVTDEELEWNLDRT